jgi:hypothetical protein
MDIQQIRDELTRRGISFAANAGLANLEAKLAAAIAQEEASAEEAKRAEDQTAAKTATAAGATGAAAGSEPEGKSSPGAAKAAAPAAAKPATPAAPAAAKTAPPALPAAANDDAYYEAMCRAKQEAGLSLEQAIEVTAKQRAEDASRG